MRIRLAAAADDDRRSRVVDDVFELDGGMRHRERHRDAAGPPDPALHCGVRKGRRHQERDASLLQIVIGAEQRCGDPAGRGIEIVVGVASICRNDGGAFG